MSTKKNNFSKIICGISIVLLIGAVCVVNYIEKNKKNEKEEIEKKLANTYNEKDEVEKEIKKEKEKNESNEKESKNPVVTMKIKDYGIVKIELYPDVAPNTVKNFIKLINDGYYNGLTIHRVETSLIQGGDVAGDGTGETEYTIKGEFNKNGFNNTLSFERGIVGLARRDYSYYALMDASLNDLIELGYNSGYAQFFIMTENCPEFDGDYCSFGKVIEGMDIVDKITKIETEIETDEETGEKIKSSIPIKPPVISDMSVETFGVEYGEPKREEAFDVNEYIMQQIYGESIE